MIFVYKDISFNILSPDNEAEPACKPMLNYREKKTKQNTAENTVFVMLARDFTGAKNNFTNPDRIWGPFKLWQVINMIIAVNCLFVMNLKRKWIVKKITAKTNTKITFSLKINTRELLRLLASLLKIEGMRKNNRMVKMQNEKRIIIEKLAKVMKNVISVFSPICFRQVMRTRNLQYFFSWNIF